MKQIIQNKNLKIMEKKSLAVQMITAVLLLIGAYSGMFTEGVQAWLGIASMALTLVLSTLYPSGTLVKGWTTMMWVFNISGIVLQLLDTMGKTALLEPKVVNGIMIGINILIQVFVKDYTTTAKKA